MVGTVGLQGRGRAWLVIAALVVGACGGSPDTSGTASQEASDAVAAGSNTPEPSGESVASQEDTADPFATLALVDPDADYGAAGSATLVAAVDAQDLFVDDRVVTDLTGFVVIDYADGSVTRLDVNTEFRLVELAASANEPQVRARLDVGRAWNNVQALGGEGRFEVETSVATAAVRGTTFLVECLVRFVCSFTVFDGEVEVTPQAGDPVVLGAGDSVTVTPDGPGEVVAAAPGGDHFVDRNQALDAGDDDPDADPDAGSRAWVILRKDFDDVGNQGDLVPLSFVRSGLVIGPHPPNCETWHLHSDGEGIFFGDVGPLPEPDFSDAPGEGCGWGEVVNRETEGPVG